MKKCKKCFCEKELSEFYKNLRMKDGTLNTCKVCFLQYYKKYYASDNVQQYRKSQKHLEYQKKYRNSTNGKNRIAKWFKSVDRKEYQKKYNKERYKKNIQFRLKRILRSRLNSAIKKCSKSGSAVMDLGCSIESLISYLEQQFQPGMTWENHGRANKLLKTWHIDHIKPLDSFDLTDRKQLLEAINYTNLQPLWAIENVTKKNKII